MMKQLWLGLLVSLSVLSACKKEQGLTYPATFQEAHYQNTTPVRMYTGTGEVKDERVLEKFLQTFDRFDRFKPKGISENTATGDEVVLENAQLAQVITGGTSMPHDLEATGEPLVFTSKEVRTGMYGQNDEYVLNMVYAISKYKPVMFDKEATVLPTGATYSYKTYDRFYAYLQGKTLEFPRLVFSYKTGDSRDYQLATRVIDNEFDPSVLSTLSKTDTLVVQEFVRVYQKK